MGRKHGNLGWAWKPDETVKRAEASERASKRYRKAEKRRKRKGKKRKTRKILYAPGHVFYESREWLRIRIKVFRTYKAQCMSCDAMNVELHVDHIKPRSTHPHLSLTFDNLQILCRDCNMEKSNLHATDYREEAATRRLDEQLLDSEMWSLG